jgi:hypothetical protein
LIERIIPVTYLRLLRAILNRQSDSKRVTP